MSYTPITFSHGETPTVSKWNLIGENDASFNDGTGIDDAVIRSNHMNPTIISKNAGSKTLSANTNWQTWYSQSINGSDYGTNIKCLVMATGFGQVKANGTYGVHMRLRDSSGTISYGWARADKGQEDTNLEGGQMTCFGVSNVTASGSTTITVQVMKDQNNYAKVFYGNMKVLIFAW